MSLAVAIGVAVGSGAGSSGAPAANPNLLLWTEEFDDAVWTATDAVVTADQATPPLGARSEAENVACNAPGAAIRQVSTQAATSGGTATFDAAFGPPWTRFSVTGTFDGQAYTFSVYLRDTGVANDPLVTLRLDRSGGFLRCSLEDPVGDGNYMVWGAQLEAAATASSYQGRTT